MITIRAARNGDEAVIVELIRELAATIDEESPINEDYVTYLLQSSTANILLAETGERVVGLISYLINPNLYHAAGSALIDELVVRAEYRGHGVGSALIQTAMDRIQQAGCAEVSVSTMFENKEAQAFYLKHGFTDHALFMERHFE